jgi:large subunit ribosomal protein L4
MELKLINEQGQAAVNRDRPRMRCSAATTTKRWCTRSLSPTRPMPAPVIARRRTDEVAHSTKKPWRQKGTGRARAGMSSAPVAWRRPHLPESAGRELHAEGQPQDVPRRAGGDPFPTGTRRPLAVVDDFSIEAPKTKLLVQKLKAMGLDSVLLITDNLDENLYLSSRNLPNVLVLEAHETDPVSLWFAFPRCS